MDEYETAVKMVKAMAHDIGYTATSLKKVSGYAQEGTIASSDLLGYLTVKCEELRQYADDLEGQVVVIRRAIEDE